jgi:hypothetical protein
MESPWNPALIQARILRSSITSADPVPQATSLPEAPHPAKSEIFCKTVSGRVMVRAWAETWERGELHLEWVMGLEGSWVSRAGRWGVEGEGNGCEGGGGRGGVSSVDGARGLGRGNNTEWVRMARSGRRTERECEEGRIREGFWNEVGPTCSPCRVLNM